MSLKALVTLDLPDANDKQRQDFYKHLEDNYWHKIKGLTTAWKLNFNEKATKDGALSTIKARLENAKNISKIKKFEASVLVSEFEVEYMSDKDNKQRMLEA